MIYDYYLQRTEIKSFEDWDEEKEHMLSNEAKKRKWREKDREEKYKLWIEEIFVKPLAKAKKEIRDKVSKEQNHTDFYPKAEGLRDLPENSAFIKIPFKLKKPYTSKGEEEFNIINDKIFENPIVRDKTLGCPMVRPSTWKGHLKFAAIMTDWEGTEEEKQAIIDRLFGPEKEKEPHKKGRLYFFPTFFTQESTRDVITPLDRKTRTPARGPIHLEVIDRGTTGEFYLLYLPYPKEKDFRREKIGEDLRFLAKALISMFYTYGFSAKKTSGFGVIEEELPEEGQFEITGINKEKLLNEGKFKDLNELSKIAENVCNLLGADNEQK